MSDEYDWIYDFFRRRIEREIGSGLTYTDQVARVAKAWVGDRFDGVYSADRIPDEFTYIIANLDREDEPGSHWIALAKTKGRRYMVYDSFGRSTDNILDIPHETVDVDNDAEQADEEDNCGARCVAWLTVFDLYGEEVAKLI